MCGKGDKTATLWYYRRMSEKQTSKNTQSKKIGAGKPGPGRKKGVPNKLTMEVKDAIKRAFDEVGGVEYLKLVAMDDPKVFCALLGKIVPAEIAGTLNHQGETIIQVVTGVPRAPNEPMIDRSADAQ
jgi:hypothetical protein